MIYCFIVSDTYCSVIASGKHNIPALSLMVETHNILDHVAAASLLKVLNGVLDLNIETDNLIRDGEQVQEEIKKLSKQLKRERDRYREEERAKLDIKKKKAMKKLADFEKRIKEDIEKIIKLD